MSDNRNDDTEATEPTGELRDNTINFGDEFGEVKFADADDTAPSISVDSTDTAPLPHWSEQPTGESPRFGVQPRDPSRPALRDASSETTRDASRPIRDTTRDTSRHASPPPVSRAAPSGRIRIGSDPLTHARVGGQILIPRCVIKQQILLAQPFAIVRLVVRLLLDQVRCVVSAPSAVIQAPNRARSVPIATWVQQSSSG